MVEDCYALVKGTQFSVDNTRAMGEMSKSLIHQHPSRVVFVTGASSGIGRAVALQFGSKRARVALVARRRHRLEEVGAEVKRLGGESLAIPANVAERSEVEAAIHSVVRHWGRLDILINNAGNGVFGTVEECLPEDFEQQVKTNYLATVYAVKAVLPLMRRQGSGVIINVSSVSGKATSPFDSAYCASKFALNAFTSVLRMELARTDISVSLICPGYTKTEWETSVIQRRPFFVRTPLRPMSAERVAREIVACAEKPKREVLIPKILVFPVLLQSLFPKFYESWQLRSRM